MKTITQSLARVEKEIYTLPYDDLTPYLQGVRDMMNLINGEENSEEVADTILSLFEKCKRIMGEE